MVYWAAQGMPWRTEPEISEQRQDQLTKKRAIQAVLEHGVYPFRDEELTRADIEWLLATHFDKNICGPVDLSDVKQYERSGLDLRGARLSGQDLSGLPLTRLCTGVTREESYKATRQQREAAAVHLEGATLTSTHLEGANLRDAHLEGAYLRDAHLEGSALVHAHLEGATLQHVHLEGCRVPNSLTTWPRVKKNSYLLPPADLHLAFFDTGTSLSAAIVGDREFGGIRVADVHWNNVNLARTPSWRDVSTLADELVARYPLTSSGAPKDPNRRFDEYQTAVRSYRQLALALRSQGVNEDSDRFAYRAQMLQRQVLIRDRHYGRAFGSWLLDLISGYGYKPMRSVITYLVVILSFAVAYFALTNFALTPFLSSHSSSLAWYEAIVLSISTFHGRGLFPSGLSLGDPIAILAAFEAIIGLLIEITFIATFTQRFFAR
jgi:hypothetical protein